MMEFLLLLLESACMIAIRAQTGMQLINNEEKNAKVTNKCLKQFPFSIKSLPCHLVRMQLLVYKNPSYHDMPTALKITIIIATKREMAVNIYSRSVCICAEKKCLAEKTYTPALEGI